MSSNVYQSYSFAISGIYRKPLYKGIVVNVVYSPGVEDYVEHAKFRSLIRYVCLVIVCV